MVDPQVDRNRLDEDDLTARVEYFRVFNDRRDNSDRYRDPQMRPLVHEAQDDPLAEWARRTGRAEPMAPGVADTRAGIAVRGRAEYVPGDADQPYQTDPVDYTRNVLVSTRAQTSPPDRNLVVDAPSRPVVAGSLQVQLQLAQQVAEEQVRLRARQQHEAGDRLNEAGAWGEHVPAPLHGPQQGRGQHR